MTIDIIWTITILVKLISAIYRNEKPDRRWNVIVKEYTLKGLFIFDLASCIPFYAFNNKSKTWYFLKLLRLTSFQRLLNNLQEFLHASILKLNTTKQLM